MAIFGGKDKAKGEEKSSPEAMDDPREMAASDLMDAIKAGDAAMFLSAFDRLSMQSEPEGDESPPDLADLGL